MSVFLSRPVPVKRARLHYPEIPGLSWLIGPEHHALYWDSPGFGALLRTCLVQGPAPSSHLSFFHSPHHAIGYFSQTSETR
jgi:hypothetical protein